MRIAFANEIAGPNSEFTQSNSRIETKSAGTLISGHDIFDLRELHIMARLSSDTIRGVLYSFRFSKP